MRQIRSRAGMTLVELMIVVALIGVISSIAIPSFMRYQARARRSEAFANLSAISRVQKSFMATRGYYHDSQLPFPNFVDYGSLGTHKMAWDAESEDAWGELGWKPEGKVFHSYQSNTCTDGACPSGLCFTASAYGDVDGDGKGSAVMYVEPERAPDGSVSGACRSGLGGDLDFGTPTGPGGSIYNQVAVNADTDEF